MATRIILSTNTIKKINGLIRVDTNISQTVPSTDTTKQSEYIGNVFVMQNNEDNTREVPLCISTC